MHYMDNAHSGSMQKCNFKQKNQMENPVLNPFLNKIPPPPFFFISFLLFKILLRVNKNKYSELMLKNK